MCTCIDPASLEILGVAFSIANLLWFWQFGLNYLFISNRKQQANQSINQNQSTSWKLSNDRKLSIPTSNLHPGKWMNGWNLKITPFWKGKSSSIHLHCWLGGGFIFLNVHPYLRKWSNLTNIFRLGWFNHQLVGFQPLISQRFFDCFLQLSLGLVVFFLRFYI